VKLGLRGEGLLSDHQAGPVATDLKRREGELFIVL
jgi:hypothetical protein